MPKTTQKPTTDRIAMARIEQSVSCDPSKTFARTVRPEGEFVFKTLDS